MSVNANDAVLIQVADAIADELVNVRLNEDFSVRRSYADWDDVLADEEGLMIDVVPIGFPSKLFSRGKLRYLCTVNVLARKLLKQGDRESKGRFDNEAIDPLVKNLQIISEYFATSQPTLDGRRLASLPGASWQEESGVRQPFSPFMLRQHTQFSGLVSLTHLVSRAAGS